MESINLSIDSNAYDISSDRLFFLATAAAGYFRRWIGSIVTMWRKETHKNKNESIELITHSITFFHKLTQAYSKARNSYRNKAPSSQSTGSCVCKFCRILWLLKPRRSSHILPLLFWEILIFLYFYTCPKSRHDLLRDTSFRISFFRSIHIILSLIQIEFHCSLSGLIFQYLSLKVTVGLFRRSIFSSGDQKLRFRLLSFFKPKVVESARSCDDESAAIIHGMICGAVRSVTDL
jgi:hypothetical protein